MFYAFSTFFGDGCGIVQLNGCLGMSTWFWRSCRYGEDVYSRNGCYKFLETSGIVCFNRKTNALIFYSVTNFSSFSMIVFYLSCSFRLWVCLDWWLVWGVTYYLLVGSQILEGQHVKIVTDQDLLLWEEECRQTFFLCV